MLSYVGGELSNETRCLVATIMVSTLVLLVAISLHWFFSFYITSEVVEALKSEDETDYDEPDFMDREEVADLVRSLLNEEISSTYRKRRPSFFDADPQVIETSTVKTDASRPRRIQRPPKKK